MNTVIIDPSIATILKIKPVGRGEKRPVIFTAAENWPGVYSLKVWDNDVKNESFVMPGDELDVTDNIMTWWIEPTKQSLLAGTYYVEIFSEEFSSIIYKGTFEVLK